MTENPNTANRNMTSENKDEKTIRDTHWYEKVVGCVGSVVVLMIGWLILCIPAGVMYIIQSDTVKEIYDPCTYPVGKVLNITIPTEQNTLMATYETRILQKKKHCDENLFIDIVDTVYIPRDFTGTLTVEITKIRSPYRYSAKIIHIKPNQRITQ